MFFPRLPLHPLPLFPAFGCLTPLPKLQREMSTSKCAIVLPSVLHPFGLVAVLFLSRGRGQKHQSRLYFF